MVYTRRLSIDETGQVSGRRLSRMEESHRAFNHSRRVKMDIKQNDDDLAQEKINQRNIE